MKDSQIPVIVIAGPTAVGKTALSLHLAHYFDGEIINGDSLQVYKEMTIGTAKLPVKEREGIPHHLLDYIEPTQQYDASQFKHDATRCIRDCASRQKLPIVVGGTGLYLEGLLYDLSFGGAGSSDETVRNRLRQIALERGNEYLWNQLYTLDPIAANNIPVQNQQRIIRALEVIEVTGEKFSNQETHREQIPVFNEQLIILDRPREQLYERINERVMIMLEQGLEQEVYSLYQQHVEEPCPAMKGIGYKEWIPYFEKRATLDETIATIQQNSRRYAKRQLTWFRNRFKRSQWFDAQEEDKLIAEVTQSIAKHLA